MVKKECSIFYIVYTDYSRNNIVVVIFDVAFDFADE